MSIVHKTGIKNYFLLGYSLLLFATIYNPGIAGEVEIPDEILRAKIEQILGKSVGDSITSRELREIRSEFDASDLGIIDLTGFQYLTNLSILNLAKNQISNIEPLANLKNLTHLNLDSNQIIDIRTLSSLKNLVALRIANNRISDIRA